MKARRRRPNPCRDLERLEGRELLSQGATPVLGGDPFANSTTDNPAAQTGTLYPDSQVEPDIVVNPTRPNNVVALWQQDRWSNGGARGIVVAVSSNGGNHWTQVVLPGVSKVSGGEYDRVSNAWMSFAPDGTLYVSTIAFNPDPNYPDPFNTNGSAVYVSKSTDGGYTWSAPTTIINDPNPDVAPNGDPELVFNDKDTVTADPTRPGFAYVVWDRTVEDLATGAFTGPAYFSMTTDGGRTWSTPEAIYTPPVGAQTLDNQIVVLPDGTLVDMFSEGTLAGGSVDVIRSTDHGRTWSAPIAITPSVDPVPIVDPDTGAAVRSANVIPDIAVDPRTGALYVVTQQLYDLPNGPLDPGINLFTSTDGGRTWSAPVRVNQTPTNIPAADQQAFDPMVAVAADGTVAVSYDDFRNNTPAPGALTDRWIVFYRPCGFWAPPGGVTNPANWGGEQRLTTSSWSRPRTSRGRPSPATSSGTTRAWPPRATGSSRSSPWPGPTDRGPRALTSTGPIRPMRVTRWAPRRRLAEYQSFNAQE